MVKQTSGWHQSNIGNSGSIVKKVTCPMCGKRVIYNGNYFCEEWGFDHNGERSGGYCDWTLETPATRDYDIEMCDALGIPRE